MSTSDLPPDVLAAATKQPPPDEVGFEEAHRELVPLADRARLTLASIQLFPVAKATPEQRTQMVKLRAEILRLARDAQMWVDAIDLSFRQAAQELGNAREIPLADGVVKVEPARDDVKIDVGPLKQELIELSRAGGPISLEEIEDMFTTTVEIKANGTKLNYFERNRGAEVAAAIARHRRRTPASPLGARLSFIERA